jgi:broad specificity phosphatase PhoE
MIWILIRHAHRDTHRGTEGRALDNGLSAKGRRQAAKLQKYFKRRFGKDAQLILMTSPSKRCQETLQPISKLTSRKLVVSKELSEQNSRESSAAFEKRVNRFLKSHAKAKGMLVICSHGDWIPRAVERLSGARLHLEEGVKKGSWIEIEDNRLIRALSPEDL